MKFLVKTPEKFMWKCDDPNFESPKTRNAKTKYCVNYVYVEIEDRTDISHQIQILEMITRIFSMLPAPAKEDKTALLNKIKQIVWKNQFYDMNEYFICKFE